MQKSELNGTQNVTQERRDMVAYKVMVTNNYRVRDWTLSYLCFVQVDSRNVQLLYSIFHSIWHTTQNFHVGQVALELSLSFTLQIATRDGTNNTTTIKKTLTRCRFYGQDGIQIPTRVTTPYPIELYEYLQEPFDHEEEINTTQNQQWNEKIIVVSAVKKTICL